MNKKNLYIFLLGLSLAGYAWLGWNTVTDEHSPTPTVCMFKEITHLPCPACGTTRSLISLMHGRIAESLLINPFGTILALALVIIPFWIIIDLLRKSDSFFRSYLSTERLLAQHKWISRPAIAVVVFNWFWNIAKGL